MTKLLILKLPSPDLNQYTEQYISANRHATVLVVNRDESLFESSFLVPLKTYLEAVDSCSIVLIGVH